MSSLKINDIVLPEEIKTTTSAGAIELYENIFSKDISQRIINEFESADKNQLCPIQYNTAKIGNGEDGGAVRSNLTMSLYHHQNIYNQNCDCQVNSILNLIREKLSLFVRYYSLKYDLQIEFDEGLQLLKYSPGRQYKPHTDYGPGAEHRILSGLIYLNPGEYLGGSTYFTHFDCNISPDNPAIALFPSNYAYQHAAKPVFEGYKYAIVTWFGPPWAARP